jgi:hypothetical protein
MFSPRKKPLLLVADRLLALRMSLNTPVVATPDLPAGPARAAIVVHGEGGRTCFTVAVRSLRNGASVLYELEGEDPDDASGIYVALDAALSFAESMGFLFDDELVTERSEPVLRAALARLREVIAPPGPEVGETAPALEPTPSPEEILLEEALELEPAPAEPPAPVEPSAPAAPRAPAPPAASAKRAPRPAAASLTKFRAAAAAADDAEGEVESSPPAAPKRSSDASETAEPARAGATGRKAPGGGAMLGRVKPVRLRAPDASPPVHPLLRLLSSF